MSLREQEGFARRGLNVSVQIAERLSLKQVRIAERHASPISIPHAVRSCRVMPRGRIRPPDAENRTLGVVLQSPSLDPIGLIVLSARMRGLEPPRSFPLNLNLILGGLARPGAFQVF
jgi:hypothetical protein